MKRNLKDQQMKISGLSTSISAVLSPLDFDKGSWPIENFLPKHSYFSPDAPPQQMS